MTSQRSTESKIKWWKVVAILKAAAVQLQKSASPRRWQLWENSQLGSWAFQQQLHGWIFVFGTDDSKPLESCAHFKLQHRLWQRKLIFLSSVLLKSRRFCWGLSCDQSCWRSCVAGRLRWKGWMETESSLRVFFKSSRLKRRACPCNPFDIDWMWNSWKKKMIEVGCAGRTANWWKSSFHDNSHPL